MLYGGLKNQNVVLKTTLSGRRENQITEWHIEIWRHIWSSANSYQAFSSG